MGIMAVDLLAEGKANRVVGYKDGKFVDFDINKALEMTKDISDWSMNALKLLAL